MPRLSGKFRFQTQDDRIKITGDDFDELVVGDKDKAWLHIELMDDEDGDSYWLRIGDRCLNIHITLEGEVRVQHPDDRPGYSNPTTWPEMPELKTGKK